jgi:hypothetical protein
MGRDDRKHQGDQFGFINFQINIIMVTVPSNFCATVTASNGK